MLLFDQNISYRIVRQLQEVFPNSLHVTRTGLEQPASDIEIWKFAKENNLVVVTFDEDFSNIQTLHGFPPKVIWLRFYNQMTKIIASKLIQNAEVIKSMLEDKEVGILEIY